MEIKKYVDYSTNVRSRLAKEILEFRAEAKNMGVSPKRFNRTWDNQLKRMPDSVTLPALRRQILDMAYGASRLVPDLTMDDGYSRCGEEDRISDYIDGCHDHARFLLEVLIYQMREQEYELQHR